MAKTIKDKIKDNSIFDGLPENIKKTAVKNKENIEADGDKKPSKKELILTPQQMAFAMDVANGLPQREAFLNNYPNALTWTKAAQNTGASRLYTKPHVRKEIDKILADREKLLAEKLEENPYMWTREKATILLLDTIDDIDTAQSTAPKLSAAMLGVKLQYVQELNLMNGFNKTNVNNESAVTIIYADEDKIPD